MVVASLLPEITKQNWQQLLDAAKNIRITRETIAVNYDDLSKLRELYLFLEERRKAEDEPDKDRIKARKEGYDTYMKPIKAILEMAEPDFIKINGEMGREERAILAAIDKQNDIRKKHVDFVNDIVKLILIAPDNKELARIQMLIGSEKSRTNYYGDYHQYIGKSCDELLQLVDGRKDFIKDNAKLIKDRAKAEAAGDVVLETQLKEQIDMNEEVIRQNAQQIAESAYTQVTSVSMIDSELVSATIKPRLRRWSWRIDDIDLLLQKSPELVLKEPNKKAITAFMKEKTKDDELDEHESHNFNGLIIYKKPFFVAIKTSDDAA